MKVIGSVIARIGSKRLTYKNLLPYRGKPIVVRALEKLVQCSLFDEVVLSTDSELIARNCHEIDGVKIIRRPMELSSDNIPSIPVFQHIIDNYPADIHLNYNCNFPICPASVFEKAIELTKQKGEALSIPYAVWSQTRVRLDNYGDPMKLPKETFHATEIHPLDIHTMDDLLNSHIPFQDDFVW